jgi:FkbM family methyltransferase
MSFAGTVKMLTAPLKLRLFTWILVQAYRHTNGVAHRAIQAVGRQSCGTEPLGSWTVTFCRWFMDCIFQAQGNYSNQHALRHRDLGAAPIGFAQLRIRCCSGDANSSSIYLLGMESNSAAFWIYRRFARPGTAAVDVGANLGIHSLVLAECVGDEGYVYAFEPLSLLCRRLEENLRLNGTANVCLHEVALGDSPGSLRFYSNMADFNIGKGRVDPRGNISVQVVTADHFLHQIDRPVSIIKIDTEGHELEVLKGATGLLEKYRPVIVMEFNPRFYTLDSVKHWIPSGYSCFEMRMDPRQRLALANDCVNRTSDMVLLPDELRQAAPV